MKKSICAAALLTAAVGALGYEYVNDQPPPPKPSAPAPVIKSTSGIGLVEPQRLIDADLYGDQFARLDEREHFVRLELQNAMRPITITEPTVESKPFDDSVWQKNAQTIISEVAEIERRKKQAADDYRKATESIYLKRRDAINNQFLNEILNIKLKLQNAKVMRLTDDELRQLEARLGELQLERGQIQRELEEQWIKEIAEHAETSIQGDVENLRAQARASMERVKAQAAEEQAAAQARDRAVMERSQALMERRQLVQSLTNELEEIVAERQELEKKLLDDIEDETVRLAVVHNLTAVLSRRHVTEAEKFYPFDFNVEFLFELEDLPRGMGAALWTTSASIDLTDDIIKSLKKRQT